MAGFSLRRLWSWISIVILPGCLFPFNADLAPCDSYLSDASQDGRDRKQTEIMVFLREGCDGGANITDIQGYLDRSNFDARINVIPLSRKSSLVEEKFVIDRLLLR